MSKDSSLASSSWSVTPRMREMIDTLFAGCSNTTPGAAIAIYRDGKIAYANGYGIANLEHNAPITPATVFDIASTSKQFTAMCVALLQQVGSMDIDDPIQKHIPELPTWENPVTIRHLIHHVSGITDYLDTLPLVGWRDQDQMTIRDCLNYIMLQKTLDFEPNTRYSYNNSGYVLLAILVERISGESLAQFAEKRIFLPLGMTNSRFIDDHTAMIPNRAQAYRIDEEGAYHLDTMPLHDVIGDGGLFTSVMDFARWDANFVTAQIGGADLIDMIQTTGVFKDGSPMEYAWGLGEDEFHGFRRIRHKGGWGGYGSNYFRLPELGFGVAVFSNLFGIDPVKLTDQIASIVLDKIFDAHTTTSTRVSAVQDNPEIDTSGVVKVSQHELAGVYIANNDDSHLIITLNDDGEPYIASPYRNQPLQKQENGTFTQAHGRLVIVPTEIDSTKRVTSLRIQLAHSSDTSIFNRVPQLTNEVSLVYDGRYYSDELDTWWNVAIDERSASLAVQMPRSEGVPYIQVDADQFKVGAFRSESSIRFRRDDTDSITGFTYSGRGMRRIEFMRVP